HAHLLLLADVLEGHAGSTDPRPRITAGLSDELLELMRRHDPRRHAAHGPVLPLWADRERARVSSWYALFPRSWGPPGRHGTLRDAIDALPDVAGTGVAVLYLPPIHPISTTQRKGPNHSAAAGQDDVGSPWAIGSEAGGHLAVHPRLGTLEDLEALRVAA